ncbi:hypothetical protein [Bacillus sp. OAE603]|uniref:hypothetical protein n=1 Tax=Gottfriedia sp. OAE603 TaxID=2663872 RepID=UPI00178A14D8
MGKKLIVPFVCIIVVIANAYYFTNYYETKKEAVTAAIKVNTTDLKKENYQLVNIPNSSYFICITDIPHSMYVYKTSLMLHKYKATLYNVEHLYAGDGAGIHYVNGKLAYGFTKEKPKDKDIYINQTKMNVFELGKYFKNSKYEITYRNLVLYYPDQPMVTKNSSSSKMGFDEVTYR